MKLISIIVVIAGRSLVAGFAATTSRSKVRASPKVAAGGSEYDYALLFDCDGVILETEEFHRLAYNAAFENAGLTISGEPVNWSVEYYDVLQNTIGGGKPKMNYHFRTTTKEFPMVAGKAAPATPEEEAALIDALQEDKTNRFKQLVETSAVCRPGVLELMDQALDDPSVAVGVCSASTKAAAQRTLGVTLGDERVNKLDVCILGDDVSEKKPSPMIYNEAAKRVGVPASRCVVIEDSMVGLRAAKGAEMKCVITYTDSTKNEDFYAEGADAKIPNLGDRGVTLSSIFDPIKAFGPDAQILEGKKDP